jgi:hypothetical protein
LSDSSSGLRLRLYSKAMTVMLDTEIPGNFQPGWNSCAINLGQLENGLYYALICAQGEHSFSAPAARLMVIR